MTACPTFSFSVIMQPQAGLAPSAVEALWRAWTSFLETRGLVCDRMNHDAMPACVVSSEASQATESDRQAAAAWLAARGDVAAWHVGDLE